MGKRKGLKQLRGHKQIDGSRWKLNNWYMKKPVAQSTAAALRKKGDLARVVPVKRAPKKTLGKSPHGMIGKKGYVVYHRRRR